MSLRSRFAIAFALVAAVVAALVGLLSYGAASDRVDGEIDRSLTSTTGSILAGDTGVLATPVAPPATDGGPDRGRGPGRGDGGGPDGGRGLAPQPPLGRIVAPDGTVTALGAVPMTLPVTAPARAVAASGRAGLTDTAEVTEGPDTYRVLTTGLADGRGALQVAVDVDLTLRVLHGLAIQIAWVSLAVLVAAAAAGWLLARRITRRLVRLTGIAEDVSVHGRVDQDVPVEGTDEVARLSASFNTMLGRLAASREAQDRLVQDAAHELRTPLTSLRTNASVLRRLGELSPEARERLLDDVVGETRELSDLVEELVELALARRGEEAEEPVDLAAAAQRAATRLHRRTGRQVRVDTDGSVVSGRRQGLERAVGNLLENAAKFDAEGTEPIEVEVRAGRTTVSDRGPGIDAGDATRVFDRFFRADSARGLPGSGLGLAIVRDVAEGHGGLAFARERAGGGAVVGFSVDTARLLPASDPDHVAVSPGSTTVGRT